MRADFAAGQFTAISRYADVAGTELVASSFYAYDGMGRLLRLLHTTDASPPLPLGEGWGEGILAGYLYAYDAGSRITSIDSYWDDLSEFTYDATSQLVAADHTGQADEAYEYDENGNRTQGDYAVASNNRMSSDGTYNYTYDAEGNRLTRTHIASGYVTLYSWDHRNRLIGVTEQDDEENVLSTVQYAYDPFNRRIAKIIDPDGPGGNDPTSIFFSWERDQIALQFGGSQPDDLSHRYFYGPAVDQVLMDEQLPLPVGEGRGEGEWSGHVLHLLADHLGTIRDLAEYDSGQSETTIANHRTFDAFGNITAQTNSAIATLFAFTGRELDPETGLQYHRARYYDPATGRWISHDLIGFAAGDTNLARYVK
jgi:RHS repeat-associated protein